MIMAQEIPKISQADMERVRQMLGTEDGKRLFRLLSQSGGLEKATEAMKNGGVSDAQRVLEPLIRTPEAEALLHKLNGK